METWQERVDAGMIPRPQKPRHYLPLPRLPKPGRPPVIVAYSPRFTADKARLRRLYRWRMKVFCRWWTLRQTGKGHGNPELDAANAADRAASRAYFAEKSRQLKIYRHDPRCTRFYWLDERGM